MTLDEAKELLEDNGYIIDEGILSKTLGAGALAAGLAFGNSGVDVNKASPGHVPNDKAGFGKKSVHLQQRYNYPQDRYGVPTAYKLKDTGKLDLMDFKSEVELTKKKILSTPDSMLRKYGKDNLTEISRLMVKTANKYNIDIDLLLSIAGTETNFDNSLESNKGARGMMQITKTAAKDSHERLQNKSPKTFNFDSFRDLKTNIDNAGRIIADLSVRRNNVIEMIFASYNGGTAQATSWRAYAQNSKFDKNGKPVKPLTKETKEYVERCMALYKKYKEVQKEYLQKT